MKLEQTVLVRLVDLCGKRICLDRIFFTIALFVDGKLRYQFLLGYTDLNGQFVVDYEKLESERIRGAKECPMDYKTLLHECDKQFRLSLPTVENLSKSYEVATRWDGKGVTPDYAKEWLLANNGKVRAEDVFAELGDRETVVEIPCFLI
jgi:hypothetical protein